MSGKQFICSLAITFQTTTLQKLHQKDVLIQTLRRELKTANDTLVTLKSDIGPTSQAIALTASLDVPAAYISPERPVSAAVATK